MGDREFVSFDDADAIINAAYRDFVADVFPFLDVRVKFIRQEVDSRLKLLGSSVRSKPFYEILVGGKRIHDNAVDGNVRVSDVVLCVKSIIHESRHIWQEQVLFQKPLNGYNCDAAKMAAIGNVFHGYYMNMYSVLPHELDAEIYAFENLSSWFHKMLQGNTQALDCVRNCNTTVATILPCLSFLKFCDVPY